jgi:membrane protease YdiL (CAAX protease family)
MTFKDPYRAFEQFVRPAWGRRERWRILIVLIGFEIALAITPDIIGALAPQWLADIYFEDGIGPLSTVLLFLSYGITLGLFVVCVQIVHKRSLQSMLGPIPELIHNYRRAVIAVCLVLLAVELAPPSMDETSHARDLAGWLGWIPFAIIAITLQSATEEIVYRGYLQQQLASLSSSRLVWMGLPSLLFGGVHYLNGYGPSEGILWAIWATLLGLACADLTARTGNLGAAIGLHAANNMFAALVIGIEGWPASGLALYVVPYQDPAAFDYSLSSLATPWAAFNIAISAGSVLVMWLAARLAVQR